MAQVKRAATLASTPSSSMLSHTRDQSPESYLKLLSELHDGLSKMTDEVPDSRPPSPSHQSEKRVQTLREKVKEAYNLAGGDPAQGKWGHMANLLKLTCSAGGYRQWGLGVRRSREVRQGKIAEWSSLDTEEDWLDWEKDQNKLMDAEDAKLKAKVEIWKANIPSAHDPDLVGVSIPNSSVVLDSDGANGGLSVSQQSKGKLKERDIRDLAFPVVKRSSFVHKAKKGQAKAAVLQTDEDSNSQDVTSKSRSGITPHVRVSRPVPVQPNSVVDIGVAFPPSISPKRIGDISEVYLPPSFPSDLGKSTPGPGKTNLPPTAAREKPPPIAPRRHSQPSFPPSPVASLQSRPSLRGAKKHFLYDQDISPHPLPAPIQKRARPSTPPSDDIFGVAPRVFKKARTVASAPHTSGSSHLTPPLSTSPAKEVTTSQSHKSLELGHAASTPNRQLPTLTELLRSSTRKDKPSPSPAVRKDKGKEKEKASKEPSLASYSDSSRRPVSQPYSTGLPAFTQNPDKFMPDFMSTPFVSSTNFLDLDTGGAGSLDTGTAMGPGGNDFFGAGYNSQFDLEKHVDKVSELLERDVDFAGWLKQVSEDEGNDSQVSLEAKDTT